MKKVILPFVMLFSLFMFFCSGSSTKDDPSALVAPGTLEEGVTAMCEDYAMIMDGIYKYENNTWGVDEDTRYQQCLLTKQEDGLTKYGWTWIFQGKARDFVFSYPEIITGWKPWGSAESTTATFPVKIADIDKLTINYDLSLSAEGGYNLAPEIWLISSKPSAIPMESPEKLITTEIMFWMDYSETLPAGDNVGTIELGGRSYDLWYKQDHNNSADSVSWTIYSLVSEGKQLKGSIDVIGLIGKLAAEGYTIDTNEYVATVEFGTETVGASETSETKGTVWVNSYSVELTTK